MFPRPRTFSKKRTLSPSPYSFENQALNQQKDGTKKPPKVAAVAGLEFVDETLSPLGHGPTEAQHSFRAFIVQGLGFRVQEFGIEVWGFWLGVSGLGCWGPGSFAGHAGGWGCMWNGVGLRAQSLERSRFGFHLGSEGCSETSTRAVKLQRFGVSDETFARPPWLTSSSCRTWRRINRFGDGKAVRMSSFESDTSGCGFQSRSRDERRPTP